MRIHLATEEIRYDGSQLTSHFGLRRFGLKGDCLVAFRGPMEVALQHMADLEDRLAGAAIRSPSMLHFIVELFGRPLEAAVLYQRLLARLAADVVRRAGGADVTVRGDDLYVEERKLSVSIAAPSPVSCLIHFGMNIETEGVPVPAAGLKEFNLDPSRTAELVARAFQEETESLAWALVKVKAVP